jgi:hypothetical protein
MRIDRKLLSRRRFLKIMIAGTAIFAGTAATGRFWAWPLLINIYDRYLKPDLDDASGSLTEEELQHILALAEVLYPAQEKEERDTLHGVVKGWVSARTELDGHLGAYRSGVVQLRQVIEESGYQQPFYGLPLKDRDRILNSISPYGKPIQQFVVKDLLTGIYSSTLGWSLVGYFTWPGVAGPPHEYTKPPVAVLEQ